MYIGGLDVGTTGCKLTLYTDSGEYVYNSYMEYNVTRKNGEHELDANVIFESVCGVIADTAKSYKIDAIGVTTFGESFAAVDKEGNVLLPSMLYTDPRGEEECKNLCDKFGEDKLTEIVGVKPHSMFSLPKIMWIKNNKPDVYSKIYKVLLMEDFIVFKLSGALQIDYSLAARTMAFDIRNKCWSKEIFEASGVDVNLMAKPVPAGTYAGEMLPDIAKKVGISGSVKIVNGCHDQVAAALGSGVFSPGQAVDGTGTVECVTPVFDSIPTSKELYEKGYAVVPFVFDGTYVCYALSFTGGATLKWYRDCFAQYETKLANESGKNVFAELDKKTSEEPTGILVLPHFAGAANPYMDNGSKAAVIGLTLETTEIDLYKALMEGVTYEIMNNIETLESFGIKPQTIYATGGGASSPVWLNIKADILKREITVPDAKEVGACGTCMLTAVATGVFDDLYSAKDKFVRYGKTYKPNPERAKIYEKNYSAYKKIYNAVRPIVEDIDGE